MKRSLIAAALALAPLAALAGPSTLVAQYTFEDCTAADVSGNGNDGILVGNVTCDAGRTGNGLRFGGLAAPGHVDIPASASLAALDGFTYSLWFKIDAYPSMDGYGQTTDFGIQTLFAKEGDSTGLDLRTTRSTETGLLSIWAANGRCALPEHRVTPAVGAFGLGEWHMATVTMGAGTLTLYFDGVAAFSMPSADFLLNPAMAQVPLRLGIDSGAIWYPLTGVLDDVRVYNRALPAGEVSALFNRG
jgi:hypothetical protein